MTAPSQQSAPATPDGGWPAVSVIMPVLDEGPYLREAVERIIADDYPGETEIVLALGPSRDDTDRVAEALRAQDPRVVLVRNPTGRTPAGLNAAISVTRHPVVVRVDGHGFLPPGYIRRAVSELLRTGAANVGGVMVPEGVTPFEQAVARAMSSRIGIGGGEFHVGGEAGPVETVYLGVFRRDVLERLGGFDEHFTRAQDWELNHRIREAGEVVWFVPDLRVTYRPRSGLVPLARQFHGSGRWRREVVHRHPGTANLRYLAPPLALVGVVVGTIATLVGTSAGPGALRLGAVLPAGYAGVVVTGSAMTSAGLPVRARLWLPVVVATMHLAWGLGFLRGAPRASGLARAR